jgi:hypothetical protein
MKTLLNNMTSVLDRLADGADFNALVDETNITAQVTAARNDPRSPASVKPILDMMQATLGRLANGDGFNRVVAATGITAALHAALTDPTFTSDGRGAGNAEKTKFKVGFNYTHRGDAMQPASNVTVRDDQLRDRLTYIINDVSRSCRIWVDDKLAWVWDGGKGHWNAQPKSADDVLHELGLSHLAQTAAPASAPSAATKSPTLGM